MFTFAGINAPVKLSLKVEFNGAVNSYPIWLYPRKPLHIPHTIVVAKKWDEARAALSQGKKVLFSPEATVGNFPNSIKAHFT